MKTVAQYDWTTRAEPKTGEIAGRPGKWDRQAELLLSDVDRNGEPTPIGDIHVGQLMTVTSPVGAADLSVTAVNGLRLSVGVVNGYLYPINGQVVSVKWADPPASDNFDPTPLWGAINTEIGERQDADADLQDQIDNHQHNTDHSHPDYSLTSHDHDTAYSPAGHTHQGLTPGPHDHPHDHDADYAPTGHDHDGVYEPVHDHPYATTDELAAETKARQDEDEKLDNKIKDEIARSTKKDAEHSSDISALGEQLAHLTAELPVREYTYTTSRSPQKGELAALDALAQPVTAWENTNIVAIGSPDVNGVELDLATHFAGEIVRISDRGAEGDDALARMESSYLVAEITEVNVTGSLTVTPLYHGGGPDVDDDLLLEILPPAGGIDTGELDARYSQKGHTHSVPSHTHNYASTSHTHSFSGGWVSLNHGKGTTVAPSESWSGSNGLHFHPFYWSGNRHYFGGKMNQTGLIEFRSGSGFYNKLGIAGTLIGSTNSNIVYPFIVFQVYYTSTNSGDSGTQRCYGAPIYTRQPETSWSYIGDTLHWYWKGAGK